MKIKAYQEAPENQTQLPLVAWRCEDEDGGNWGIVYTKGKTREEVRAEISLTLYLDGAHDVTLYLFDGWTRTAKYKEV